MLGELISAGASIIGGLFGKSSADKAAEANKKANAQQLAFAREQMERNEALQKEFAQSGVQWKAADAKAAGISPIYALGAPAVNFSPMSLGYNPTPATGDNSMGAGIAGAGQDISRAINSTRSPNAKLQAFTDTMQAAQLDSIKLDNEQKRLHIASQIAKTNQPGMSAGIPDLAMPYAIDGQGNSGSGIKVQKQVSPGSPFDKTGATEGGVTPDVQFIKTKTGWAPAIPQPLQEAMEDDWIGKGQWNLRNRVFPFFPDVGKHKNPFYNKPFPAPKGKHWYFNGIVGEYQLVDN